MIVAGWVFATLCIHAVAYRLLFRYKVLLFLLGLMYIPLFPYLVARNSIIPYDSAYPFTLLVVSCIVGCFFSLFSLLYIPQRRSVFFLIVSMFRGVSSLREEEILKELSKNALITSRLCSLQAMGLIEQKQSRWRATLKGRIVNVLFHIVGTMCGMENRV